SSGTTRTTSTPGSPTGRWRRSCPTTPSPSRDPVSRLPAPRGGGTMTCRVAGRASSRGTGCGMLNLLRAAAEALAGLADKAHRCADWLDQLAEHEVAGVDIVAIHFS